MKRRAIYMIGQGYQNSRRPKFITNYFFRRPEVYSPYTPYQAEISQGRLELLFEYQTMIQNITKMDIAVSSMLDSGQVGMDLITLIKRYTKKDTILIQKTMFQTLKNCIYTRAIHQDITIIEFDFQDLYKIIEKNKNIGGIIYQTPDTYGSVYTLECVNKIKQVNSDIIHVCNTDLMSNIFYEPNNKLDFVFGNGGNMGIGLNYGGPQPAFLASNKKYIRFLPGKIVGKSVDTYNNECYRLGLQMREQHIKREKSTSNICTNQALLANMSLVWGFYYGNTGLQVLANKLYDKTNILYNNINSNIVNNTFFNTITIENNDNEYEKLIENDIYTHKHINNYISLTVDERAEYKDIYNIIDILNHNKCYKKQQQVQEKKRKRKIHNIFNQEKDEFYLNEQQLLRYLYSTTKKDYSLLNGLIPLGSCTMKHTPVDCMERILNPFMNIHPYIELEKTPYKSIIENLSEKLKQITGFKKIFYQSQSGAMGEYAGLTTIQNYYHSNNITNKKYVLMPKSAHGTNASSCILVGYQIIYVNEKDGMIDIFDLDELIKTYKHEIACFMITYPSTYGLFEKNIKYIIEKIHSIGSFVYMDGANMNALIGKKEKVSETGFDVCHFNLHKSFAIPHGGGGPGMGPIAVNNKLKPYLPQFSTREKTNSISTVPYGSGLILQISNDYLNRFTEKDFEQHHRHLINQTKLIVEKLSEKYKIINLSQKKYMAHEFIIDTSVFKKEGIKDIDISKRLIDYGFHSPTMSWPILNSLMIEITETETKIEIDRFIKSMFQIYDEIYTNPDILKNAPHTQEDLFNWKYQYSVMDGCFPLGKQQLKNKVWPSINRINDIYGDRKLLDR